MKRLLTRLLALACLAALVPLTAQAQPFPTKQAIKLVLPFAAGGLTDIVGRITAQKVGEALGQAIVVENVAGAGGTLAATQVARAPADGYTLLFANASTLTITPTLYRNLAYDAEKSFVPIGPVAQFYFVMGASNAVPPNNLKDLITYARANPGKLNYASPGFGTTPHLAAEMLKKAAAINLVHVPYKGASPAVQALAAGDVQIFFDAPTLLLPMVQSGKIKALAVTSPQRMRELPQVPTAAESGVKEIEFSTWSAWVAPAGTPPEVVGMLRTTLAKVLATPEMREALVSRGFEPYTIAPDAIPQSVRSETLRWAEIIKAANIKIE
jgi:tripartite-type tricarboxylate transporter receptor subunit TctC